MRKLLFAAALILFTTACTTQPTSPAQTVYATQTAYAAALSLAVQYKSLPACGGINAPVLCSDVKVVKQIQDADNTAYVALQAAQAAVRNPVVGTGVERAIAYANQAVGAFTAIVSSLKLK